jgi:hypothetical protein
MEADMTDRNHRPDHAETITATKAKQGRWGWPVLWILIVSTAAATLALLGIMGVFWT